MHCVHMLRWRGSKVLSWCVIALCTVTAPLISGSAQALPSPIPSSRTIDWSYTGVPGGIPHRTTICKSLGVSNMPPSFLQSVTSAQIESAINGCASDQVVYLNAGTYSIGQIYLATKSHVTLRGAGIGQTILNSKASGGAVIYSDQYGWSDGTVLSSGYSKGSTSVTLSGTNGFEVGNIIKFDQVDDTNLVLSTNGPGRNMGFLARITAIDGNALTFSPPLPYGLTASLTPRAYYQNGGPGIAWTGIENMTINNNGGADNIIYFDAAYACWVKNVEMYKGENAFLFLVDSLQSELRDSYVHYADNAPSNPDGYGIYIYYSSSYNLVINNIFDTLFIGMLQSGASANAYLYNYVHNGVGQSWPHQLGVINANHGAHNMMTLWEGNVAEQWQSDGYHGSASHQTLFRNWLHGLHPTNSDNRKMIDAARASYYFNVVGNVLGYTWADKSNPIAHYEMSGEPGYNEQAVIYRLGYPNMANNALDASVPWALYKAPSYPDVKVKDTMIRHGNFDYYTGGTSWDATIANHSLPPSLRYTTKPDWWPAAVAWPPIGPDVPGLANKLPAQLRFEQLTNVASITPSAPSNLKAH